MTTEQNNETPSTPSIPAAAGTRSFSRDTLPWVVLVVALLVYLATATRWVTFASLLKLAQIAGWDSQPVVTQPVWFLVTYPIKWVPPMFQAICLNLLTVALAAWSVMCLARSVALLPHDRTRDQRIREPNEQGLLSIRFAWVPPALAAMVLGLHRIFWEQATVATGEMLDLFLFAYVVLCLLEFRVSRKDYWLVRLALVYGLATTNNWAMIGFFPLVATLMLFLKGREFFRFGFLAKTLLAGMLGLSLYFVLPALATNTQFWHMPFWQSVTTVWAQQKNMLLAQYLRLPFMILSLTSIIPLFFLIIRWPSFSGDINPIGAYMENMAFRTLHVMFFVMGVFVMCKAPYQAYLNQFPIKFLTLHYTCALMVGYLGGYLLLVFGRDIRYYLTKRTWLDLAICRILASLVFISLLTVPIWLTYHNLPVIRATNAPTLKNYARLLASQLPESGAALVTDDPYHLYLVEAYFALQPKGNPHLMINSRQLQYHSYHEYLLDRYRQRWWPMPTLRGGEPIHEPIPDSLLLERIMLLDDRMPIYYLHPSFGYYFEAFYTETQGLVQKLKRYPPAAMVPPPLTVDEIKLNQDFWNKAGSYMLKLVDSAKVNNVEATVTASWYSRALTLWGVRLQRQNSLKEAAESFQRALSLNPQNLTAQVNLAFNKQLAAGKTEQPVLDKHFDIQLGAYRSWDAIFNANGPFDDLFFTFHSGRRMARGNLYRQAFQQFLRVKELDKNWIPADLAMAETFTSFGLPGRALEILSALRASGRPAVETLDTQMDIARLEAMSCYAAGKPDDAEGVLLRLQVRYPKEKEVSEMMANVFLDNGKYDRALEIFDQIIQQFKEDPQIAMRKVQALMRLGRLPAAIEVLTDMLRRKPDNHDALYNRGLCYLNLGQLEWARFDFDVLRRALPSAYPVTFYLGEIAYRIKDDRQADRLFSEYLMMAPSGEPDRNLAAKHLAEVRKRK
ncbi:MAG: tetratricopeptide repeat protein [Verrucomicrobiota bacterium]